MTSKNREEVADNVAQSDERSPLLSRTRATSLPSHSSASECSDSSIRQQGSKFYPYALLILGLFCMTADLGGDLVDTPEIRLLEMAVCRDYYRSHDPTVIGDPPLSYVAENLCKRKEIQAELAYIRATKSLLMNIPGLLLTYFYGRLADKIGRKPILLLGLTGQLMALLWMVVVCYFHTIFSTKLVLLSPVFVAIGGGNRVLTAMTNTIVADVAPDHAITTTLYLLSLAVSLTQLIAIPTGSWLLSKDLWLPWCFSITVIILAYPVTIALPETLPKPDQGTVEIHEQPTFVSHWSLFSLKTKLNRALKACFMNWKVTLCLLIVFLNSFSMQSSGVFVQYVSKSLNWHISKVGYLLTIKAGVAISVLVVLVIISQFLEKEIDAEPLTVDIIVARCSLCLLLVGNLTIGFGSTTASMIVGVGLLAGGTGISSAMQGIVAAYTRASGNTSTMGQVYAALAIAELSSSLLGGLIFASIFDIGLRLDTQGLALPYYTSAALFALTLLLSLALSSISGSSHIDNGID